MSTTVRVRRKRQAGAKTELRAITPPTDEELREVFRAAGGPGPKKITSRDDRMMAESIRVVRGGARARNDRVAGRERSPGVFFVARSASDFSPPGWLKLN